MNIRRPFVTAACAATLIIPSALIAQQDTTRRDTTRARGTPVTSQQRLKVQKRGEAAGTLDVRADSIAAAERERVRRDSVAAAERERMRLDSIAVVERARADSIARVEKARADSIAMVEAERARERARLDSIAAEQERYRQYMARYRFGGHGWYVGLAAGAAAPMGNFENLGYQSGFDVNMPIGYHKENRLLGMRIDLGYNRFSGRNFSGSNGGIPLTLTNGNPQVFSGTLNVTAALPFTPVRNVSLYGVGGAGLYHFRGMGAPSALSGFLGNDVLTSNESANKATINKVGAQIGAGLDWTVGTSSIFVESRLVHVFADRDDNVALRDFFGESRANGLRWVPIVVGVKIR